MRNLDEPIRSDFDRRWANNLDEYKQAGFWPRHRKAIRGRALELADGEAYFDRIPEGKLCTALGKLRKVGGTLFLHGPRGTGKTQLATWLALMDAKGFAEFEEGAYSMKYWSWPTLMDAAKDCIAQHIPAPTKDACRMSLLVLDELGEGLGTDYERSAFTQMIDYRYGHMHRTILIANLDLGAIETTIGTSAFSRITETGAFLACDWDPYR